MELEPVSYEASGRSYTGFLADGSGGGRAPGVLVIHEGGGLTGHTKERASRLAELGYVAFAMDLFGPDVEPPTPAARTRWPRHRRLCDSCATIPRSSGCG